MFGANKFFNSIFSMMNSSGFDMNSYKNILSRNTEALNATSQAAIEGSQALLRKIAITGQDNIHRSFEYWRNSCSSQGPEEMQNKQSDFINGSVSSCYDTFREMTEMLSKYSMEVIDIWNKRTSEMSSEFNKASQNSKV